MARICWSRRDTLSCQSLLTRRGRPHEQKAPCLRSLRYLIMFTCLFFFSTLIDGFLFFNCFCCCCACSCCYCLQCKTIRFPFIFFGLTWIQYISFILSLCCAPALQMVGHGFLGYILQDFHNFIMKFLKNIKFNNILQAEAEKLSGFTPSIIQPEAAGRGLYARCKTR